MKVGKQRDTAVRGLTETPLDLLIIGGGIVGAGVARDAAMRGLKVGLVEQHDFAFGTSSRSSRLLHGGLRYLAQGRVGLVHEASVEKKIIHHIAPHLAEPLPFIFPTYRGNKNWVLWQLKIGVKIYDVLCSGRNLGKSTWLSRDEVRERVPALTQTNLNGAVRYYDGFTNDARLTLDTLRSAAKHGASIVNYCRFLDARRVEAKAFPLTPALSPSAGERGNRPQSPGTLASADRAAHAGPAGDDQSLSPLPRRGGEGQGEGASPPPSSNLWLCEAEDTLRGAKFAILTRAVVNATGPWADGLPHSRVKLRVTKGIHLVVERAKVPVPDTVVMTEGKRILFAIPWGERTILGTTDTDYHGSLDEVTADAADINYVVGITNQFFPDARLKTADVLSTWAGLRPLIANPNGKPSDISRSHDITNPEPGWWDVAGGKLTTYRLMAEQTVDRIISELKTSAMPCRTAQEPLLPPAEVAGVSGILPSEFSRRSVAHYCANEWAAHLDDVMVRRTSWHYYFRDAAQKAERVADWMGEWLGWSAAERAAELQRYHETMDCPSFSGVAALTENQHPHVSAHPVV